MFQRNFFYPLDEEGLWFTTTKVQKKGNDIGVDLQSPVGAADIRQGEEGL